MSYEIRFCRKDERGELVAFLRENLGKSHVLTVAPNVLDWSHLQGDRYNFVVAMDEKTKRFHGVIGFMSSSFFARQEVEKFGVLWPVLWLVDKSVVTDSTLGAKLMLFMRAELQPRSVIATGITPELSGAYARMNYRVGEMRHFYLTNPAIEFFSIATQSNARSHSTGLAGQDNFRLSSTACLNEVSAAELKDKLRKIGQFSGDKTREYFTNRFASHPFYDYRFWAVTEGDDLAILVVRKILVGDASCLRIVDAAGLRNLRSNLREQFEALLIAEGSEYIDFMVAGVEEASVEHLGFVECTSDNFVPNLFEPFVKTVAPVRYAILSPGPFSIFKGDADLDRPNSFASARPKPVE